MTTITAPTATKDAFLRFAMRLDATLTGTLGIAGLAVAPWLAQLSGTTPAMEYSMSAFYVAYGATVFALSRVASVLRPGVGVIIANLVYTVAAVAVVVSGVWPLTTMGIVLTLGSGVFTLVMADLQYLGVRRMR